MIGMSHPRPSFSALARGSLAACIALAWICLTGSRCGDGLCDGPETAARCPQDCGSESASDAGTPNPLRALVADLLEWKNWLDDGGFEDGTAALVALEPPASLAPGALERSESAARTGSWGLQANSTAGQGVVIGFRAEVEKGEDTRFSLWARSPGRSTSIPVRVLGVERVGAPPITLETRQPFVVDSEWTHLEFSLDNRRGLAYAILALEVGPDTTLYVDDAAIEASQWKMADPPAGGRWVGGVPVPASPVAPVHFAILIHIEDPALLLTHEAYFRECTEIFRRLAELLCDHGGFLTIQPEEDWVLAAQRYAPSTLADLSRDFGVAYSTHTHGPNCVDPTGRPRSADDCSRSSRTPGWIADVDACCDPLVPLYVDNLQTLLAEVSGTAVTDHNGNWEFRDPAALAGVDVLTWSAFKNNQTQRTFGGLMTNPWRPSAASARDDPGSFVTHDAQGPVIYIPGWGQSLTQHHERVPSRLAPLLSQFIRFSDAERINTCYVVTHIGHFDSEDGSRYATYDPTTGIVSGSQALSLDLAFWDCALRQVVDPLVAEGYVQWTRLSEMGELFASWESRPHEGATR
ncbi:MAG: hypothetical protein AB1778_04990 [Candidatus Bipolaricaulota bacterium]